MASKDEAERLRRKILALKQQLSEAKAALERLKR